MLVLYNCFCLDFPVDETIDTKYPVEYDPHDYDTIDDATVGAMTQELANELDIDYHSQGIMSFTFNRFKLRL